MKKSGSTSTLPVSPMVKTEGTEESVDKDSTVESELTYSGITSRFDEILRTIPAKGGISRQTVSELKYAIDNGLKDAMKLGAAEASVSHGGAAGTTYPIKTYSIDEVQGLVSAVIKELVPVLVTGTRENPTGYGSASRNRDWDTLAKSVSVKAWKGPTDRAWESVRLDVKKNAKIHGCLGIIDGSWVEPDEDTEPEEHDEWSKANTRAIILISNMFCEYEPAEEIIRLYTEEDDLNGNAYDCWIELDSEFDDDRVYDRVVLEEEYNNYFMQPYSRFVTKLNNQRKKLKRVGLEKDDKRFSMI